MQPHVGCFLSPNIITKDPCVKLSVGMVSMLIEVALPLRSTQVASREKKSNMVLLLLTSKR